MVDLVRQVWPFVQVRQVHLQHFPICQVTLLHPDLPPLAGSLSAQEIASSTTTLEALTIAVAQISSAEEADVTAAVELVVTLPHRPLVVVPRWTDAPST